MFAATGVAFAVLYALVSVSAVPSPANNATLQARAPPFSPPPVKNDPIPTNWKLHKEYKGESFINDFNFFRYNDPTLSRVNYLDRVAAQQDGLVSTPDGPDGKFIMKVDSTKKVPAGHRGRDSVRIESAIAWPDDFLVVADISHMPVGCGVWPAFWTLGVPSNPPTYIGPKDGDMPDMGWPGVGEIDIIEQVSDDAHNFFTAHTGGTCQINKTDIGTGSLEDANCEGRGGCKVKQADPKSYGTAMNNAGGGIFVMRKSKAGLALWHTPKDDVNKFNFPDLNALLNGGDISEDQHLPGPKAAQLRGNPDEGSCNPSQTMMPQKLVLNIALCGEWGKSKFNCGGTCDSYVDNNPEAYRDAYWEINRIAVYLPK